MEGVLVIVLIIQYIYFIFEANDNNSEIEYCEASVRIFREKK